MRQEIISNKTLKIQRLGCWAARRCCPAWPWCKPTTSQAKRGWCHRWVKDTGPVLRATKLTRSTATTTTDTRFTTDNPTTVTWATLQPGAVHPCWYGKTGIIIHQEWWMERTCKQTRICNPRRSTKKPGRPAKWKWSIYFHKSIWAMTVPWKSRRTSSVTTAMELSGVVTTSSDTFLHTQERSHLLVTRATCGSSSATTWTDTSGCTAGRSRTSVIAAIRTSPGQTGCWDTDASVRWGWAKRKASSHRMHPPIQLPGAPYSLPTTVWLSDPPLPTEILQTANGSLQLSDVPPSSASTVSWQQRCLITTKLYFALASSLTELDNGFLYIFLIYYSIYDPDKRGRTNSWSRTTGLGTMAITEFKMHMSPFSLKGCRYFFLVLPPRDCKYFWLFAVNVSRSTSSVSCWPAKQPQCWPHLHADRSLKDTHPEVCSCSVFKFFSVCPPYATNSAPAPAHGWPVPADLWSDSKLKVCVTHLTLNIMSFL